MAGLVNTQFPMPTPSTADGPSILRTFIAWANTLVTQLFALAQRSNLCLPNDGSESMTGPLVLVTYTTATIPTASASNKGAIIFVSDAASGSHFQGSTGSAWVSLG